MPTNEPAWKVKITLRRKAQAQWTPHEYIELSLPEVLMALGATNHVINQTVGPTQVKSVWIGEVKGPGKAASGPDPPYTLRIMAEDPPPPFSPLTQPN